jgi:multidrug efflux system outer membrane protein
VGVAKAALFPNITLTGSAGSLSVEVKALRRAREIADARYRVGYASYFDVINADRDLFVVELALAQTYTNSWDSLVRLYASLGGGWQQAGTPQAQASPSPTGTVR